MTFFKLLITALFVSTLINLVNILGRFYEPFHAIATQDPTVIRIWVIVTVMLVAVLQIVIANDLYRQGRNDRED